MRMDSYGMAAAGPLVAHWTRHDGDPRQERHTYQNQNIDHTRTRLNYTLGDTPPTAAAVRARIREIAGSVDRAPTARTKPVASAVITLDRGHPDGEDPRKFFAAAYEEMVRQVGGPGVVVGAWVHVDETTPHMHFVWVPVATVTRMTNDKSRPLRWTKKDQAKDPRHRAGTIKKDKKGTVRYKRVPVLDADGRPVTETTVSLSASWTRERLRGWHPAMEAALTEALGRPVSLLLDEDDAVGKALSDVPQAKLDAVREAVTAEADRAREEAERQAAAAEERLERLRRAEVEAEPAAETVSQSARYIRDHSGDAERARGLERELEQAREREARARAARDAARERCERERGRLRAAEGERQRLAEQVRGVRARARALQTRCSGAWRGLTDTVARMAHVPAIVVTILREVAWRLGAGAMARQRQAAAHAMAATTYAVTADGRAVGWDPTMAHAFGRLAEPRPRRQAGAMDVAEGARDVARVTMDDADVQEYVGSNDRRLPTWQRSH